MVYSDVLRAVRMVLGSSSEPSQILPDMSAGMWIKKAWLHSHVAIFLIATAIFLNHI